jgi:ribosomal protein L14
MIFKGSLIQVGDNSGGKIVKCINIFNKENWGTLGSLLLVTLVKFSQGKKVKKKQFYLGLLVRIRYWSYRFTGFYMKFTVNSVLLYTLQFKFLGSRILGIVDSQFKIYSINYKDIKFSYKMLGFSCKVI